MSPRKELHTITVTVESNHVKDQRNLGITFSDKNKITKFEIDLDIGTFTPYYKGMLEDAAALLKADKKV